MADPLTGSYLEGLENRAQGDVLDQSSSRPQGNPFSEAGQESRSGNPDTINARKQAFSAIEALLIGENSDGVGGHAEYLDDGGHLRHTRRVPHGASAVGL